MFVREYADYLPRPMPELPSNLQGWAKGHQQLFDTLDEDLQYVIASYQVDRADGDDLDEVGADFGLLGRRFGRGDGAYRQYLKALPRAYTGRGTTQDIKVAVSGGLVAEPEDIKVHEDYQNLEYQLTIHEWREHELDLVDRLANLADSSVTRRVPPITYVFDQVDIGPEAGETTTPKTRAQIPEVDLGPEAFEADGQIIDSDGLGSDSI